MLKWFKQRARRAHIASAPSSEPPKRQSSAMSGKYLSLYTYLANRYADTVVLTFAEIESLLGFTLPDPARLHQDWWTNASPEPRGHTDAWVLANRTAKPNLIARTVVFERAS